MKKLLPLLCAVCLVLASCSYEEITPGSVADTNSETASDTKDAAEPEITDDTSESETVPHESGGHLLEHSRVTDDAGAHFSSGNHDLRIDMSKYSKAAKLLTVEDILLLSFNCGYVSDIRSCRLIIETEQQLDCATNEYGSMIADLLDGTAAEYPISDYSYVVEYVEVSTGGYDLKAGALLVDTDTLFFVQSADSVTPDLSSVQTTVMDGFCYMAVLPKGTLMNGNYQGWIYPESKNLLQ